MKKNKKRKKNWLIFFVSQSWKTRGSREMRSSYVAVHLSEPSLAVEITKGPLKPWSVNAGFNGKKTEPKATEKTKTKQQKILEKKRHPPLKRKKKICKNFNFFSDLELGKMGPGRFWNLVVVVSHIENKYIHNTIK